ncbi:MAG TPA: aminotransferase class V-fold PLP-dependent enzyme [Fervidicoccus fontis]|uniref:Aminotransferase class V-fold PLP-dependent enzyme n=1 Tax=Fervidicoccus fontis TaxID=683846 RepID=A0A7C2UL95_9CREN|nr:aminotransferase class V-fold PLP-dependent enzyme [Fervidicoccus fontis]
MFEEILSLIFSSSFEDPKHESGEVLGSMTTPPPPEVLKVVNHFISKNLGDPSLFRSLQIITEKLENITKEILHLPQDMKGIVTSGGTESNILALFLFRETLGTKKVLFPDTAHYSISKAAKILSIESEKISTYHSGKISPTDFKKKFPSTNAAIVLTMGTTELGGVDDPRDVIDNLEGVPLHIDAAFGGFTFPFINPEKYLSIISYLLKRDIEFTISVDFHKFLGAPIPSGMIFVPKELVDPLYFEVDYIMAGKQFGLLGTRPGFSTAAALATLSYYGEEGLSKIAKKAYENTIWFLDEAERRGIAKKVNNPEVPIGCLSTEGIIDSSFLVSELAKKKLYVYKGVKCNGIRVVTMPHVERGHLEKLLQAIELIEKREIV